MGAKRMGAKRMGAKRMEVKTPVLTDKREDYKAKRMGATAHGGQDSSLDR